MSAISAIVSNPSFGGAAGEIATRQFGSVAADLSKCLHQICDFVSSKSLGLTKYALKYNSSACHEEVMANASTGKLVVSLKQDNAADYGFSDVTMMDAYVFVEAFDEFIKKHTSAELKSLSQYYRIFLLTLVTMTSRDIYGRVEEDGKSLKLHIGKYDKDFKPIQVLIKLELS